MNCIWNVRHACMSVREKTTMRYDEATSFYAKGLRIVIEKLQRKDSQMFE